MKQLQFNHREKFSIAFLSILLMALLTVQKYGKPSINVNELEFEEYRLIQFKEKPKINYSNGFKNEERKSPNKYRNKEKSYYNNLSYEKIKPNYSQSKNNNKKYSSLNLNPFDPNTVSMKQLEEMGLNQFFSKNLVKFREAGAEFNSIEDLAKIYGASEDLLESLKPFINFPIVVKSEKKIEDWRIKRDEKQSFSKTKSKLDFASIDINTAEFRDLIQLDSISSKVAGRIVNFRERLGGFHSLDQLKEVYEIDTLQLKEWLPYFKLNSVPLQNININSSSKEELVKHPYLNWKMVNIIFKYKKNHGSIIDESDLAKIGVFSQEKLASITPYISFGKELSMKEEN